MKQKTDRPRGLALWILALCALLTLPAYAALDDGTRPEETATAVLSANDADTQALLNYFREQIWEGAELLTFDTQDYGYISRSDVSKVFRSLFYQPDMFVLDASRGVSISQGAGTELAITPPYNQDVLEIYDEAKELYDSELDKILMKVDEDWTDLLKVLYCHDYIATNYQYDYLDDGRTEGRNDDLYSMLSTGKGVSQAYTMFLMALLERLDIESSYVTSASLERMWNVVRLGGRWYHVDVSADDPSLTTPDGYLDIPGHVRHVYFLLSTGELMDVNAAQHFSADDWVYGLTVDCSSPTYDSYFWADSVSPFVLLGGKWYFLDQSSLQVWDGQSNRASQQLSMEAVYDEVYGSTYSRYIYDAGMFPLGEKLYFNAGQLILTYDPRTLGWEVVFDNMEKNGSGSSLRGCVYQKEDGRIAYLRRRNNGEAQMEYVTFDPYQWIQAGDYGYYVDGGLLYLTVGEHPVTAACYDEYGRMLKVYVRSTAGETTILQTGSRFKLFCMDQTYGPLCPAVSGSW